MSLVQNRSMLPAFPRIFDDLFTRDIFNWGNTNFSATSTNVPSVNIKETNDHFEVEMAAPGMDKKDFKVELEGNTLRISSFKESTDEEQQANYTRREFSYQSFQWTFELPKDVVEESKIIARYENGLLRLTVPKKEEAKRKTPKLIQVG